MNSLYDQSRYFSVTSWDNKRAGTGLVWSGLAEAGTKISRMRTGLPRNGPPEHAIGALRNASGGTHLDCGERSRAEPTKSGAVCSRRAST
jgi:hypothetical protein